MSEGLSNEVHIAETPGAELVDSETLVEMDVPVWELTDEELRQLYPSAYELYRKLDTSLNSVKEDEFKVAFDRLNEARKRAELLFGEVALRLLPMVVASRVNNLLDSLYDDNADFDASRNVLAVGDQRIKESFDRRLYRTYNRIAVQSVNASNQVIRAERHQADPTVLFKVKRQRPLDTASVIGSADFEI